MVLVAFTEKGRLPPKEVARWILCGLLDEWGLQLQHLNPTGAPHVAGFVTVCEAFFGMEPYADSFWCIFTGRALSEAKSPRATLVECFAPTAAQVSQFIEFDKTSSSHGGHTSVGSVPVQELP